MIDIVVLLTWIIMFFSDDDEVDVLMEMLSKRQGSQGFEKNVILTL